MALDQLLLTAAPWLAWTGLGLAGLTVVRVRGGGGVRVGLVGVCSFPLLLASSIWVLRGGETVQVLRRHVRINMQMKTLALLVPSSKSDIEGFGVRLKFS